MTGTFVGLLTLLRSLVDCRICFYRVDLSGSRLDPPNSFGSQNPRTFAFFHQVNILAV